jgi:hypothetical protein
MRIHSLVLLGSLGLAGCEQYYKVDDACSDTLSGEAKLDPISVQALKRVNCYRRMTGVLKAAGDSQVEVAAENEVQYVQQNPDYDQMQGSLGAAYWLTQQFESPGFTGTNIYERLTGDPAQGGAGYVFTNLGGTAIWEFIHIEIADTEEELPVGADAVDELMRYPVFRQVALQPSWVDGAYAEAPLPQDWFINGGYFGNGGGATGTPTGTGTVQEGLAPFGRVYYMVVLYSAPHFEHANAPVLLPRDEQLDVPLYSWSENRNIQDADGGYAPTQVSYPVTMLMGTIDPTTYVPVDQNQYGALVDAASIVGPDGVPLETEVVHPGDDPEDSWPDGRFQRTTLAIYARHPFEPASWYTVYADYTTPLGQYKLEYRFRTANEDPGVDPALGLTAATTVVGATARSRPPGAHSVIHHEAGSLGPATAAVRPVTP